ncbi:DUF4365 domain-containing protein [Aeromicrobium sp. NPDC092404]|uniref:DUF4365 domain-containing protein n=1 Tax=Aeromicrobium sp. NPDC092404 TaxID=3154976 RepID=UPI00341E4FB9
MLERLSRDELSRLLVGPLGWVVRPIDQDYGIDVEVEIFDDDGTATGLTFKAQLKGMEHPDHIGPFRDIKVDHLQYWRRLDVPVLLVAYDDSTQLTYGRWIHALDPVLKAGQETTRIRFDDQHRIPAGDSDLRKMVELFRSVRSGAYGRPFQMRIREDSQHTLVAEFFSAVERAGLSAYFRSSQADAFEVQLSTEATRVALPAGVGSSTLHYDEPVDIANSAADALVVFAALLSRMNRFGEALTIVTRAGEFSDAEAETTVALDIAAAVFELHDERAALALLLRALRRGHVGTAEIYLLVLSQVATREKTGVEMRDLECHIERLVAAAEADDQPQLAARWSYNFAQFQYAMHDRVSAALWVQRAIALSPEGYGSRPEPQQLLGGAAWFNEDFENSAIHYERAVELAGLSKAGSQWADALMYAGEYRQALDVIRSVLNEGTSNWRDLFVEAILTEAVEHLRVSSQARRQSPPEGTNLSALSTKKLTRHLRDGDVLQGFVWLALTNKRGYRQRPTQLSAAAFLSGEPDLFAIAVMSYLHDPDEGLIDLLAQMLHDEPNVRDLLLATRQSVPPAHAAGLDAVISRSFEIVGSPPGFQFVTEFNIVIEDPESADEGGGQT